MLPKKNRVDKKLFAIILQKGKFVGSSNISLRFLFNKDAVSPRIAFVAPKNVAKKAVKRNLLRRRGYLVISKYLNKLPSSFFGIFFFGKKAMETFSGRKNKKNNPILDLENEIKQILSKIN